jgi:uncharacterized membrane protein (DUF106 family)
MRNFISSLPGLISLLGLLILVIWRGLFQGLLPQLNPLAPLPQPTVTAAQLAITLIVLVAALYVVLSRKYATDTEKWAFGTIGLLIGYWLPAC